MGTESRREFFSLNFEVGYKGSSSSSPWEAALLNETIVHHYLAATPQGFRQEPFPTLLRNAS